jgi:hypothetical protein
MLYKMVALLFSFLCLKLVWNITDWNELTKGRSSARDNDEKLKHIGTGIAARITNNIGTGIAARITNTIGTGIAARITNNIGTGIAARITNNISTGIGYIRWLHCCFPFSA